MNGDYVVRSEEPDGRARKLKLHAGGKLKADGVKGAAQPLRVLRRDAHGLLVVLWGDEILHGVVEPDGESLRILAGGEHARLRLRSAAVDAMERVAAAAGAASGMVAIKSPIPGLVKSVPVKPGDAVIAGQTVVVLEAMKMENEIPALHDGIVERVDVQAGQTVDAGVVLIEIKV